MGLPVAIQGAFMKKLIPFFLAAVMLTGCRSGKDTSSAPTEKPAVTSAATEATETVPETTAATEVTTASTNTTAIKATSTITEETTIALETNTVNETYTNPETEIAEFTTEDVTTTSNNSAKVNDDGSIELPIIQMN